MQLIKSFFLFMIFITSSKIGHTIASGYNNRVKDLQEVQNALSMLMTKMRYTYETLPDIFSEIANTTKENIAELFKRATDNMNNNMSAGQAWKDSILNGKTALTDEDKTILINLEKLLGKTDLEGQVGQIEATRNLLDVQLKKAEQEKLKNEKLYKTLGNVIGITIVILLV